TTAGHSFCPLEVITPTPTGPGRSGGTVSTIPSLRKTTPEPWTWSVAVVTATVTMDCHTLATTPIKLGPALIERLFCAGWAPGARRAADAVVTAAPTWRSPPLVDVLAGPSQFAPVTTPVAMTAPTTPPSTTRTHRRLPAGCGSRDGTAGMPGGGVPACRSSDGCRHSRP